MAKREPGVGQVGAKNTKTFFPAARPRPGAAQEQTPLWSMPQTKGGQKFVIFCRYS